MNVPYKLYYRLGFHPWEDAEEMTEFVASFDRLVATEETSDRAPVRACARSWVRKRNLGPPPREARLDGHGD